MSFSTTGSGTLAYRVVIDGSPYEPVTLAEMADTWPVSVLTANAKRVEGLDMTGVQFSVKADPVNAQLNVGGLEIKLIDVNNAWSGLFDVEPDAVTWLSATVNASATDIPVLSTDVFPAPGGVQVIWIDGEAILSEGVSAGNFGSCTRGIYSADASAAQYHYVTDGARLRSPEVTSWPVIWEGRRVSIFRYDEGDLLTGGGTQVYRGVITTPPRFDGTAWTFGVDSATSVLGQTFGEDLSEPCAPAGIHYTTQNPFVLYWWQQDTSAAPLASGSSQIVGDFVDNAAFCTALNADIATQFTATGSTGTLTAQSEGDSGWHLVYQTAATPREMFIQVGYRGCRIDPQLGCQQGPGNLPGPVGDSDHAAPQDATGIPQSALFGSPLAGDTAYYYFRPMVPTSPPSYAVEPLGSVPRGYWFFPDDESSRTITLGGNTPLSSSITSVLVKGHDIAYDRDIELVFAVTAVDTAARTVTLAAPPAEFFAWDSASDLEIRLGLALQDSVAFPHGCSIADVLDFVAANQQQYGTLGLLPFLRAEDFDTDAWHAIFDSLPPINSQRFFVTFSPTTLGDIVREELKAAGCFLALDSTGRLVPALIRLPAQSEVSAIATVDDDKYLSDKQRAEHETSAYGQVNNIVYRDGFNPSSGDFDGDTFKPRDVAAFGRSPLSRSMEIAQKSTPVGYTVTKADVLLILDAWSGALGGSYYVDTIDAACSEAVNVGEPIVFDNPYLVDSSSFSNGAPVTSLGVVGRVAIVLGKEWGAYSPRVRFTVLGSKTQIAGYAPAGIVTVHTNTSGNTWSITLDDALFPGSATAADFFAASDRVRVIKFNATSGTPVDGTVVSATGDVLVVTFDGVWTPGADTWYLTITDAADVLASQLRYCEVADSVGVIDSGGSNQSRAKVFAP